MDSATRIERLLQDLRQARHSFWQECVQDVPGILGARTFSQDLLKLFASHFRKLDLSPKNWALIAVGGFGRGELSFASDLDILFLYRNHLSNELRDLIQALVSGLWDAGFEVGHVVSSVTGLDRLMKSDFSVQTTYLETQLIYGDHHFYLNWRTHLINGRSKRKKKRFVDNLISYRNKRWRQYGESNYLLEPQIKQGLGGLRDLHTLRWTAVMLLGSPHFKSMQKKGWLTPKEIHWLEQAQDFLWRIRLQLHRMAGKAHDQLLFQDQEQVAHILGFVDGTEGIPAVEAFMRLFYRQTARVRRVATFLLEGRERELIASKKKEKQKILPGPFILEGNHIRFYDPELVRSRPEMLMQFFWQAAKSKAHFHHETGQIIRDNLNAFSGEYRHDPRVVAQFLEVLLDRDMAFSVLSMMMETGFLERFIPEFSSIRYRVQHDTYHLYTVDEHLLRSVQELHALRSGKNEAVDTGVLFDSFPEDMPVLFLAGLLHDIGKGQGKNHAVQGAKMVRDIGGRMMLPEEGLELLVFLVENHLLLAETALKRDLSDEKPVERCAVHIGSKKRLFMLYLLTVADSRATGPQVWNNWRSALLQELFIKVSHCLDQDDWRFRDVQHQIEATKQSVLSLMAEEESSRKLESWLDKLSLRYLLNQDPEAILRHYRLEKELGQNALSLEVRNLPGDMWELTIVCPDRGNLFDLITGVLWANGLNILSADIYTRSYGLAVDIMIVDQVPDPLRTEALWARVEKELSEILSDRIDLEDYLYRKQPHRKVFRKPSVKKQDRVVIDEQASDFYTVIEVYTWERPGVLLTISRVLHRHELSIQLAKISTPGAQVVDVFYVTDAEGNKVLDEDRHQQLRKDLLEALHSSQGRPVI